MKRIKKRGFIKIGLGLLCLFLFIGNAIVVEADKSVSSSDCYSVVDISDMVFQEGNRAILEENTFVAVCTVDGREQLKADILVALQQNKFALDVSDYNIAQNDSQQISKILADVINENPELFYVNGSFGYSTQSGIITVIFLSYKDYTEAEKQAYSDRVEQAIQCVDANMTDVEKALVLHDYLAQHCSYAYEEYTKGELSNCKNVYNAYGALVEGKAVCQGYTLAYSALLGAVGISSEYCVSSEMNHAWNLISIDGEWYHVDVTWDDPVWNTEGKVRHEYFLLSDTELANRKHYGWEMSICTATKYDAQDYWWREIDTKIILHNDNAYYMEQAGRGFQLIERNRESHSAKYVNNTWWNVWGKPNSSWVGCYSYLSVYEDYVFFNDKLNLYVMSLEDFEPQVVYTHAAGDGYIYGAMVYENGIARLNIAQEPNKDNDDYIVVDIEMPDKTYSIHGVIKSYGEDGAIVSVQEESGVETQTIGNEASYSLDNVSIGEYTLKVSKQNHVAREYIVVVEEADVQQDMEIWLLGDVTGDGVINARDKKLIFNHMAGTSVLTDYIFSVGDVTNDGVINARDKKLIYNHIAGGASLWE